jgi:hypothetical protein
MQASTALDIATIDLVIANKVLARVGAVDAYGHVSVRHPTDPARFLLSRSRSPELVERDDIMVFNLDGTVHGTDNRPPYLERFIHAAVYEARPDVQQARGSQRVKYPPAAPPAPVHRASRSPADPSERARMPVHHRMAIRKMLATSPVNCG